MNTTNKSFPHDPSPWISYANDHILLLRALDQVCPSVFEIIRIKPDPDEGDGVVRYLHDVIFIDDYLLPAAEHTLNKILGCFGYKGLDDFVVQNSTSEDFIYRESGTLDRVASPSYIVDLWLLVSLIAESRGDTWAEECAGEISLSEAEAMHLLRIITGINWVTDTNTPEAQI